MPQSYSAIWYHVIFATRGRHPYLTKEIRSPVHGYMHGVIARMGGLASAIGGIEDHVHVMMRLPQDVAVADCMRVLKSGTSGWIHKNFRGAREFSWQGGYSAFSVSVSQRARAERYIADQQDHHRVRTTSEELREFLDRHGVPYDERDVRP